MLRRCRVIWRCNKLERADLSPRVSRQCFIAPSANTPFEKQRCPSLRAKPHALACGSCCRCCTLSGVCYPYPYRPVAATQLLTRERTPCLNPLNQIITQLAATAHLQTCKVLRVSSGYFSRGCARESTIERMCERCKRESVVACR